MASNVKVRVSLKEIDAAIWEGVEENRELRQIFDDFVDDIHTTWVNLWVASGPHPYATGNYIKHIKKTKLSKHYRAHVRNFLKRHKGMPLGMVYNDSEYAHFIEYGTGPDNPDSRSPWGPNTPTPEFAPMRKTYARFMT